MKELLEELFSRYHIDVYTYLYSLCRDASLSEDLTSEVFLEVVKSIGSFRGESDIKTWLFTIARRRWYAHLKRKSNQLPTDSLYSLGELSAADEQPQNVGLKEAVERFLEGESEMTKGVVRLRLEDYSYYEISERLRISESSARVVFFRAKKKLQQYLKKEGFV